MSNQTEPHMNPGLGGGGDFSGLQWGVLIVVAVILIVVVGLWLWAKWHED